MSAANSTKTLKLSIPDKELTGLLSTKICELALRIEGTSLETLISKLYRELEKAGIIFKPGVYLSDEWGCPQNVPIIGIPFYLANPSLRLLEGQMTGVEAETEAEIKMYLRHEAGHAFNYAYRLYNQIGWQRIFGKFSEPYEESYRTSPFRAAFVRHLPGWYAQKHPDDDFAETFAVWLTPGSQWQEIYAGTPSMPKLLYVQKVAWRYGNKTPRVTGGHLDRPVQELDLTLGAYYKSFWDDHYSGVTLPDIIDADLRRLFPDPGGQPVLDGLLVARAELLREVNNWTGLDRHILRSLLKTLLEKVRSLDLKVSPENTPSQVSKMAVFLTALAMNYQFTGNFL
jgi:hypothetical protein